MRPNLVKEKWARGEIAYGAWLSIPGSYSAEIVAHAGFDWACVDMQHGTIDYQVAVTMLLALSTTDTMPLVRVPWNEPGMIGKVLDAGAMGIIIPMVNTPGQAKAAVSACRYPPDGDRSYGPGRAALYGKPDYFELANDRIAVIPMIETKQALAALDDILAVPGIDAVYVGPADLSISLGMPPRLKNDGEWEDARQRIARACEANNIVAGIHASASLATFHADAGYRMIMVSSDAGNLASGAVRDLEQARGVASPAPPTY
jgi:4-hydroxy-2-oxoheptanedioate aldolase